MRRAIRTPFRFDKIRLLHRTKHVELWEAIAEERPQIVKRFLSSPPQHWRDYLWQSRIKHSLFLQPLMAGYTRDSFCFSMPIDFVPEPVPDRWDMRTFIIQFLSLAHTLRGRRLVSQWNPRHLLADRKSGKVFLAACNRMHEGSRTELEENSIRDLCTLRALVEKHHDGDPRVEKILRQWERRKGDRISGCLETLLQNSDVSADQTATVVEWPRSKELELVAGLFQLSERCKGRAILFQADPGEGKTTLLKQIYSELAPRNCNITFFSAPKEERPQQSPRKLMELFGMNMGVQKFVPSKPISEEEWVSAFQDAVAKQNKKRTCVDVILIDDLHHFDSVSLRLLGRLLRQIHSHPVLFILSSRLQTLDLPESVVSLPIDSAPLQHFGDGYQIPFWKSKQQKSYFEQVYEHTSGNPLLFQEYLHEAIRQLQPVRKWEEGEWSFPSTDILNFPDALMDFYMKRIPALSDEERMFLEKASIQGERFDPLLTDETEDHRESLLQSLLQKSVLSVDQGAYHFRKPLLAEAFYKRLDEQRLRQFHRSLAQELLKKESSDLVLTIARHFLKGGDYSQAFQMGVEALQQPGQSMELSVLSFYEELVTHSGDLGLEEQVRFHQGMGELYFRRGKYPAAVACFNRAVPLVPPDSEQGFALAVRLVESHLLNHEILAAQRILQEQDRHLKSVTDQRILLRYYLARGNASWHRGSREDSDFSNAFSIAEKLEDYQALAQGYRQQAVLALHQGQMNAARSAIRKSLLYARRIADQEEMGHGFRTLASIAWRESRHKRAEHLLRRSIRAFKVVHNFYGTACVWNLLGNVLAERCRFTEAVDSFQKALSLFGQLDHPDEVTLAQFNLGLAYLEQGRLKEAEKIFLRCRRIDQRAGNKLFYAYDLRAYGVLCMVRGFHMRAGRLLKRAMEICTELGAEGDVLQTTMILLFNELQRKNYKDCRPLAEYLQKQLLAQQEPMSKAEIQYLLGHYLGFTQKAGDAFPHIEESLRLAKRIRHYKLTGQNLILRLILRNRVPSRNDPDLRQAIRNFHLSRNELESAGYFLQLYQAYPSLLREKQHRQRLVRMEKVFRNVQHRPKHRMLRQLVRAAPSREVPIQPFHDWWQLLLHRFNSPQDLETRLKQVLGKLSEEIHASFSLLQYLNDSGTYDRVAEPDDATTNIVDELPGKVFELVLRRRESVCLDPGADANLVRNPWVIVHEVRSCIGVPVLKGDQLLAFWYFERRGQDPPFLPKDLNKIAFFSLAAAPALESALTIEFSKREAVLPHLKFEDMIGHSKAMQEVFRQMAKAASTEISVLIYGESGTGKELVARNLHRTSRRASGPFLALNCSALPETLIESELFGFARGAFTGATAAKPGLIERAHGGTLLLDEIGDLSLSAQAKLLRVIQEREIQRLGETTSRKVDVRFLFATHKDLKKLVQEGKYREDLFYRIHVHVLTIAPLRERKEDIPHLAAHFHQKYARSFGKDNVSFSAATIRAFCEYPWPGNIREMENVIQSLLINSDSNNVIEPHELPSHFHRGSLVQKLSGASLEEGKQEFEKEFLQQALHKHRWNKTRTAQELKISRQGLINMIQRLGLKDPGR